MNALRYVCCWRVLKRNLLIALVVGTVLTAVNQYEALSRLPLTTPLFLRILANFLIPFTVSTVSAAANREPPSPPAEILAASGAGKKTGDRE